MAASLPAASLLVVNFFPQVTFVMSESQQFTELLSFLLPVTESASEIRTICLTLILNLRQTCIVWLYSKPIIDLFTSSMWKRF